VAGSTQDYPAKPVRIIDPFGAGGGPDLLARAIARSFLSCGPTCDSGETNPGAGATRTRIWSRSRQPTATHLLINTNAQAYSAALSKSLPYDPLKDFIPVASLTTPTLRTRRRQAGWHHHCSRAYCRGEVEAR